jgi:hypothetical protein
MASNSEDVQRSSTSIFRFTVYMVVQKDRRNAGTARVMGVKYLCVCLPKIA